MNNETNKNRSRLNPEVRRRLVSLLSLEKFGEVHYDTLSFERLAGWTKISKSLFYHYFSSKQSLYEESICIIHELLLEAAVPEANGGGWNALESGLKAYGNLVENYGKFYVKALLLGPGMTVNIIDSLEQTRTELAERTIRALRLDKSPETFAVVRGWVVLVESSGLHWLVNKMMEMESLRKIWLISLKQLLAGLENHERKVS